MNRKIKNEGGLRGLPAFLDRVRRSMAAQVEGLLHGSSDPSIWASLTGGKLLRSRLAARFAATGELPVGETPLIAICTATEIVHAASLFHDDLIDEARVRRSLPTLWSTLGPAAAVIVGDLLFCRAMRILLTCEEGLYLDDFVTKVTEMCAAEAEHELAPRGRALSARTCQRLARGKTGALFAFLGRSCGGSDGALARELEEVGYALGTAYQLADDVLDRDGNEDDAGKSLGSDSRRGKYTLAAMEGSESGLAESRIRLLCQAAMDRLEARPPLHQALATYLSADLEPVLASFLGPSVCRGTSPDHIGTGTPIEGLTCERPQEQ